MIMWFIAGTKHSYSLHTPHSILFLFMSFLSSLHSQRHIKSTPDAVWGKEKHPSFISSHLCPQKNWASLALSSCLSSLGGPRFPFHISHLHRLAHFCDFSNFDSPNNLKESNLFVYQFVRYVRLPFHPKEARRRYSLLLEAMRWVPSPVASSTLI